jgi:hypothetical protein
VFLDQAVTAQLTEPFDHGVHSWSHFCLAGRSEVVQELPSAIEPIGAGIGGGAFPLRHGRQYRAEAGQRVGSSGRYCTFSDVCWPNRVGSRRVC